MTARRLDGARVAAQIREELASEVAVLAAAGCRPGLGVALVGDDPASAVYVASKTKACAETGIHSETARLGADATTAQVLDVVRGYNARADVHGILVQLPLPKQVDTEAVLHAVDPKKDVDGFHPENVGLLVQKRPRFVACTPAGVMELLRREGIDLRGQNAVVLGRSDIVGKPMALLLLHADATVTICHSRTRDLSAVTRQADVLVAAIGKAGFVRALHVKPGAIVVDVGINRITDEAEARELLSPKRFEGFRERGSALVGDVHAPQVEAVAGALTPVPGGVGPLTIASLLRNTVRSARWVHERSASD
ncbi:MAG: bifunctional methylenetetrahydrofolate dehydrogenase/methenyltetrahydrofolate cyclohydrolase FolD [Vicinamibacteria bacterium]|nr:bifunctional methylenetetrahydrofolate dehydrogenase/methenyltetrahydrofolate cyclohydrolase FolD [Vicinamibacteria bacterium]